MTAEFREFFCIFFGGNRIMDLAGSDDDKEPVVFAVNDVMSRVTGNVYG